MATRPIFTGISLCSGVGMLDEGFRAGAEYLGIDYRTVCYVEREAFAAARLVALMEAGALDEAPIWTDLTAFDGAAWRGRVDCVSAGFPCQPHSVAGKRSGLADARWIWPDIANIVRAVVPRIVWLENVPGLVSTGGLACCLEDLAAMGFDAEWGVLSAGAVGASHKRDRIFILAWRELENAARNVRYRGEDGEDRRRRGICQTSGAVADTSRGEFQEPRRRSEKRTWAVPPSEEFLGNAGSLCQYERGSDGIPENAPQSGRRSDEPIHEMGNASRIGRGERRSESARQQGRPPSSGHGGELADADRARSQGRCDDAGEHADEWATRAGSIDLFAPGPGDPGWRGILNHSPYLSPAIAAGSVRVFWDGSTRSFIAPTTQPGVRVVADGMALVVDESRTDQLRAIGNGVVPLQAATAFILLARRAGLFKD